VQGRVHPSALYDERKGVLPENGALMAEASDAPSPFTLVWYPQKREPGPVRGEASEPIDRQTRGTR
jgi:hypothetical protein